MAGGGKWLDVRLPSEFQNFRIDDAVNIPLYFIRLKLNALDKNTPYVVCCDTGRRSSAGSLHPERTRLRSLRVEGRPRRHRSGALAAGLSVSPRSFRSEGSGGYPPPGSIYEYKPPSLLAEHKGMAVVFVIICLALACGVYRYKSPHPDSPQTRPASATRSAPPPPIYVEAIPQSGSPAP